MTDDARLETLEFKLAHLERGLQELSDVVVRQQRELDELRTLYQQLVERLLELTEQAPAPTRSDEVPPHY